MEWLVANWFWLLIGVAFIAMHLFGHGGHGMHGGHGAHAGHGSLPERPRATGEEDPAVPPNDRPANAGQSTHRH